MKRDNELKFANLFERIGAFFIDFLFLSITSTLLFGWIPIVLKEFGMVANVLQVIFILIYWLMYFTISESTGKQGTLGKRALKLKVINNECEEISGEQALGRYLGKIISGVILGFGFWMILFTKHNQGLHDIMSKTYVVRAKTLNEKTIKKFTKEEISEKTNNEFMLTCAECGAEFKQTLNQENIKAIKNEELVIIKCPKCEQKLELEISDLKKVIK